MMVRLCFVALAVCALIVTGCPKNSPEKPPVEKETETDTGKETPKPEKEDTPEPEKETEKEDAAKPEKTEKEEPEEIEVGVIETDFGKIVIEFYPDIAPKTVARMKELIEKGFYNGLTFHRVVPAFCIQGGCPDGTGRGGTGQNIPGEFSNRQFDDGAVGMARSRDPNSNDCQFFITLSRAANVADLDGQYTLFGHVIEGLDVAHKIEQQPVIGQKPKDTILILSFTLEKRTKEE
jgi:peptidylprolyl isomerase